MVLVTEHQLRDAIGGVFRDERLIAEAAGAAGVAALTGGGLQVKGRRTAVILSGANIDGDVLASLI